MSSAEITKYQQNILETVYKKTYTLCTGPIGCGTTFAFNLVIEDFLNRAEGNFLIVVLGYSNDLVGTGAKIKGCIRFNGDMRDILNIIQGNYYDEVMVVADNFLDHKFDAEVLHKLLWSRSGQEPCWVVFNNPADIWERDSWWGKQGWLDFSGNSTASGVKVSDSVSWVDGGRIN